MDFQPDRIDFSANLADSENGSVLPLKYSIGVPLKPGDNPNDAADYAYGFVSEWAKKMGFILCGHSHQIRQKEIQSNDETLKAIDACKNVEELNTFKKVALRSPLYHGAWIDKNEELSKQPNSFTNGLESI